MAPDIAILICTYNRSTGLAALLETACNQSSANFGYEVIVVDNNSSDDTKSVIQSIQRRATQPPRYVFEGRQGKSFALNTGLEHVNAPLCVIIDDDQSMPEDYLSRLVTSFAENAAISFIGGKVLPIWEITPPEWLTPGHWSPLGMADHGDEPFFVDQDCDICLLTFAFRVEDVLSIGGFRNELGVTGSRMGSTEDADLIGRLIANGKRGIYMPELVLRHHAPLRRMTRQYYYRWHYGHGGFSALRRDEEVERASFQLLDVPSHMYRQAFSDLRRSLLSRVFGRIDDSFDPELRLSFFFGFFAQRAKSKLSIWGAGARTQRS
jgi:glycosyltransferase involved in cell wall biosynthesis